MGKSDKLRNKPSARPRTHKTRRALGMNANAVKTRPAHAANHAQYVAACALAAGGNETAYSSPNPPALTPVALQITMTSSYSHGSAHSAQSTASNV